MQKKNTKNHFLNKHRYLLVGILCLFGICLLSAQDKKKSTGAPEKKKVDSIEQKKTETPEKKKTRVDLLYADEAQADKQLRPDVQVLIGSVRMKHDSMYMFCDSALIFEKINSVEAFGNVRMEQGDTLFIYGDYLYYDGMSQLAMLRENVRMINRNTVLTTDSLNYDRLYDLGYYFEGGTLTDEDNVLTSEWGEYSPATKLAVFNHDVKLVLDRLDTTLDLILQSAFRYLLDDLIIKRLTASLTFLDYLVTDLLAADVYKRSQMGEREGLSAVQIGRASCRERV